MTRSRSLQARMLGSIALIIGLTIGFLLGVWSFVYGVLEVVDTGALALATVGTAAALTVAVVVGSGRIETAFLFPVVWLVIYAASVATDPGSRALATISSASLLAAIAAIEFRQVGTVERVAGAVPVDPEDAPRIYRMTTRVAALYGVPVPTIAISEREAPEAMAVGLRPGNVHLVLSLGTLRALEDDELEAVIAHELAHVVNRDAMVMTAVSVPVVLAAGLKTRLEDPEDPGVAFVLPLLLVANVTWLLGRAVTATLSRARERVADRAAAEVTGSPAALASALGTLDDRIAETPRRDLRAVSGVSSLSILSLEDDGVEKVMLGPDGDEEPAYWWLRKRLGRLERLLFRTHPPTEDRLEELAALEGDRS